MAYHLDLADPDLADDLHADLNIADKPVPDLLYHVNDPAHITPRVDEHLHHIVADLQHDVLLLVNNIEHLILLVTVERHLAMSLC